MSLDRLRRPGSQPGPPSLVSNTAGGPSKFHEPGASRRLCPWCLVEAHAFHAVTRVRRFPYSRGEGRLWVELCVMRADESAACVIQIGSRLLVLRILSAIGLTKSPHADCVCSG